jgi:hypothetical protein
MADNSQSNVIVTCVKCGAQYQGGVIGRKRTCALCGGQLKPYWKPTPLT